MKLNTYLIVAFIALVLYNVIFWGIPGFGKVHLLTSGITIVFVGALNLYFLFTQTKKLKVDLQGGKK